MAVTVNDVVPCLVVRRRVAFDSLVSPGTSQVSLSRFRERPDGKILQGRAQGRHCRRGRAPL